MPRKGSNDRQRRAHSKSKNGCITCKARHHKCDEGKPDCEACRRTGRKCGGYVYPTTCAPETKTKEVVFRGFRHVFVPKPPSAPSASAGCSALEQRALCYFRERTLRVLQGLHPTLLWPKALLSVQYREPAITNALVAVAALHEAIESPRYAEFQQSFDALLTDSKAMYAAKKYTQALGLTREGIGRRSIDLHEARMLSLLFTVYENMRGNRGAMTAHAINGMWLFEETPSYQLSDTEAQLKDLFWHHKIFYRLHGTPHDKKKAGVQLPGLVPVEPLTQPFSTFYEAKMALIPILDEVTGLAATIEWSHYSISDHIRKTQARLREKFYQWKGRIEPLSRRLPVAESVGIRVLHVQYNVSFIFLEGATEDETFYDKYAADFAHAFSEIEAILPRLLAAIGGHSRIYSFDLGLIGVLFYTILKCRHPTTRRRGLALLHKVPRCENYWDALESGMVAKAIVDIEEHGEAIDDDNWSAAIPLNLRVFKIDFADIDPVTGTPRKLLLRCGPPVQPELARTVPLTLQ